MERVERATIPHDFIDRDDALLDEEPFLGAREPRERGDGIHARATHAHEETVI